MHNLRRVLPQSWSGDDLVVHPHHADRLRRPDPRLGHVAADRHCTALTWNVFRTLELIAPGFWLRRFRARLVGASSIDRPCHTMTVRLWTAAASCDRETIASGAEAGGIDFLVESDTAIYGGLALYNHDVGVGDTAVAQPDVVLQAIDALSRYAGVRDCYVAVVTSDASHSPVGTTLANRYGGSRQALLARLPHRHDGLANVRGIGVLTWSDMAAILRDCAAARALGEIERFAAARTVRWLESTGVMPAD
jgi:hypothetical protein